VRCSIEINFRRGQESSVTKGGALDWRDEDFEFEAYERNSNSGFMSNRRF
jgi:hypothetical protein